MKEKKLQFLQATEVFCYNFSEILITSLLLMGIFSQKSMLNTTLELCTSFDTCSQYMNDKLNKRKSILKLSQILGYQSCHLRHTNIVLIIVSFFKLKIQLLYVFVLDQQSYYRWDNTAVQGVQESPGIHWWERPPPGNRGLNKKRCCAAPFTHQERRGLLGKWRSKAALTAVAMRCWISSPGNSHVSFLSFLSSCYLI